MTFVVVLLVESVDVDGIFLCDKELACDQHEEADFATFKLCTYIYVFNRSNDSEAPRKKMAQTIEAAQNLCVLFRISVRSVSITKPYKATILSRGGKIRWG